MARRRLVVAALVSLLEAWCSLADEVRETSIYTGPFSVEHPDPTLLVWDPPSKYLPGYRAGWLNVPVLHDPYVEKLERSPRACIRVLMKPAARQPAPLGPILLHCGGPGTDASCALPLAWGKWMEMKSSYLVGEPLSDFYDYWSISQRGMSQTSLAMFGFKDTPCPFKDENGDRIQVWPQTRCRGIVGLLEEQGVGEVMRRLGTTPEEVSWDLLNKIRTGADPQTFGVVFYNETYVRWLYRLVALEQSLCFQDQRFYHSSKVNRTYNLLYYTSTVATTHDIDLFRQAIGARKMSVYGVSYGTKVGSIYATLYPDKVYRLILDGSMSTLPSMARFASWVGQAAEAVWTGLASACDTSVSMGWTYEYRCPAGPNPTHKLHTLLLKAKTQDQKNIAAAMLKELKETIEEPGVPKAAHFMKCLNSTYVTGRMTDCFNNPSSSIKYKGIDGLEVIGQVLGLDIAGRLNEESFIKWWDFEKTYQPLGLTESLFPVITVGTWPVMPYPDPPAGNPDLAPLIIGNLHDGETPYAMSQQMKIAFPRGHLLTSQFYGHGLQGPHDVQAVIDRFDREKSQGLAPTYDNEVAKLICVKVALVYLKTGSTPRNYVCKAAHELNLGPGPSDEVHDLASNKGSAGTGATTTTTTLFV